MLTYNRQERGIKLENGQSGNHFLTRIWLVIDRFDRSNAGCSI
jgi:hypothetical protein